MQWDGKTCAPGCLEAAFRANCYQPAAVCLPHRHSAPPDLLQRRRRPSRLARRWRSWVMPQPRATPAASCSWLRSLGPSCARPMVRAFFSACCACFVCCQGRGGALLCRDAGKGEMQDRSWGGASGMLIAACCGTDPQPPPHPPPFPATHLQPSRFARTT